MTIQTMNKTEIREQMGKELCKRQSCIFYFIIYFWLPWVFMAAHGLSLVAASKDYSLAVVGGLLIAVASHCITEHKL